MGLVKRSHVTWNIQSECIIKSLYPSNNRGTSIDRKVDSPGKIYLFISTKHPHLLPLYNHASFNYQYETSKKLTKNP